MHEVTAASEMRPGDMRAVTVGGRRLVLCCTGEGEFRAVSGVCPHRGGPLEAGVLSGTTASDGLGRYEYVRNHEILHCPWHGYEFDVITGQPLVGGSRLRLKTYATTVDQGRVYVDDGR